MREKQARRSREGVAVPRFGADPLRAAIGIGTVTLLAVLLSIHFLPDRVGLHVGDRSPAEIRASRSVSYVDSEATERQRQYAAERVGKLYDYDRTAMANAVERIFRLFQDVRNTREKKTGRRVIAPGSPAQAVFPEADWKYLLNAPPEAVDRAERAARRLVEVAMLAPIRSETDDLERARVAYNSSAQLAAALPAEYSVLKTVGAEALRPNQTYARERTERQRQIAERAERPVMGEVRAGEVVVAQGAIFRQQDLDKCEALGLVTPRTDFQLAAAIFALAAVMVALVGFYIRHTDLALYSDHKRLALLAVIVLLSAAGMKLSGALFGIPFSFLQSGYLGLMSVVAAGMLIAVLLNPPLAILVAGLLSAESGMIHSHEARFAVMTMVSSLVGIFSVSSIRDRSHLFRAAGAVAVANVILAVLAGALLGDSFAEVQSSLAWAVLAGVFATFLYWVGVAMLEKPFGILTPVWLLELSSSERPLLRRLCIEAPGTYAHSIMVGNLAEAGAEAIGADALFCRVASYYHDVGKIKRPHCFAENQAGENIHDRLAPSLSALVIAAHVRDGVQLAEQHKLPAQIRDVIAEHHGTSLIRYFYHQAVLDEAGRAHPDPVLEQRFRYDGPKPQSRESGIIMLADTVEAAARSLGRCTPAKLKSFVVSLIEEKLADGQLDDCNLTLKDIRALEEAFVRVLAAMLHRRMEYPDVNKVAALVNSALGARNGDLDSELPAPASEQGTAVGGGSEGAGL